MRCAEKNLSSAVLGIKCDHLLDMFIRLFYAGADTEIPRSMHGSLRSSFPAGPIEPFPSFEDFNRVFGVDVAGAAPDSRRRYDVSVA